MLDHFARTRRCRNALKPLGRLQGVTGREFLRRVSEHCGRQMIVRAESDLLATVGVVAETLPVGRTLVISYDASLRDEPLDNTLFHEGAHVLLGHLDDAAITARLEALDMPGRDVLQHWGTHHRAVARSQWDVDMERDAETVAQLLMTMQRTAAQRHLDDPAAGQYRHSLRKGRRA